MLKLVRDTRPSDGPQDWSTQSFRWAKGVNKMDKQPTSRSCFMCGRENDFGLKMKWYNDPDAGQVWGEVVVPLHFNGYPGVVHGGIVAAILDETSGRALMMNGQPLDELFITTRLEVKYHLPTPTEQTLRAVGWVIKRTSRIGHVGAEIRLPDGTVTARCEATVVRPTRKFFEKTSWDKDEQDWRVEE
jgi:uncharacterized protein (TIGR00369 family)